MTKDELDQLVCPRHPDRWAAGCIECYLDRKDARKKEDRSGGFLCRHGKDSCDICIKEHEEVRSTSSTGGIKGTKLARFDLLPVGPLTELAKHYGRGCAKYSDRNWELGYEWSKSYASLQRHANAFWGGEDIDPETGTPHIIAVAWHALALAEFMNRYPEFDDRSK